MELTSKKYQILAVDDDPHDLDMLTRIVRGIEWLHPLKTAQNGVEALGLLENVDMVLLDINMPEAGGRELFQKIREQGANPIIVVLSTSAYEADIRDFYQLGVHAYMTKPFKIEKLRAKIENVCRYWFETVELPPPSN